MNSTIKIVMYMVAPIGAEISKPVKKYLFIKFVNLLPFFLSDMFNLNQIQQLK